MDGNFYLFLSGLVTGIILCGFILRNLYAKKILKLIAAVKQLASKIHQPTTVFSKESRLLFHLIQRIVSELEEEASAAKDERNKLTTILDSMSEGLIAVNSHLQILLINPSAQALFEISKKNAAGKSLLEAVRNETLDAMMTKAIMEKSIITKEIEISRSQKKFLQASAVGIAHPEDETVCGILVLYDLTEIRKLENIRRDFVANVSHELRTPLTSILGFIETLTSESKMNPEHSQRFLKLIEEDAKRLNRLIGDLLELSTIESRETVLKCEPVDLADEIKNAAESLEPSWKQKKLTLRHKLPASLPKIQADRDQIKQVLLNLLDNAIKFNRLGGEILIEVAKSNSELTVTVRDTGDGIPAELIPRVFERFFRVDKARSRELGGTGLGLAIVKHIIEAHGGKVSCSSEPGRGTSFSFTLPLR